MYPRGTCFSFNFCLFFLGPQSFLPVAGIDASMVVFYLVHGSVGDRASTPQGGEGNIRLAVDAGQVDRYVSCSVSW